MKMIFLIILLTTLNFSHQIVFEKIKNSKFSNAEVIDQNILVSYNGGISKYSYDFKLVSEVILDDLVLNSNSKIHQIGTNMLIIKSTRAIYLLENDEIKYTINYDSLSFFRQVLVTNSNTFLVLNVELTTSIISYELYNTEKNETIKTVKSSQGYNHYSCSLSKLSDNIYISCFLLDETDLYYSVFDADLNKIKDETKIESLPESELRTNYLYSISITDTKIILLLIKNNEEEGYLYKSYLVIFEIKSASGIQINKIGPDEDFVVYDRTYAGNGIFHLKKIDEEEFVVVFPIDESKKEFYFSFFEYKSNTLSVKEGYHNIPLSFQNEIQGINFLKIESDYAITFNYFNDEEQEELKETYLSYLTTKTCDDFKITIGMNKAKDIEFSKYISLDLISPEPDVQKMKINNANAPSILFLYDNNPLVEDQFYDYNKWSINSRDEAGDFVIYYSIYSSNDYKISTCKITFTILEPDDTTKEGEEIDTTIPTEPVIIDEKTEEINVDYESIILEREIQSKVEELKDEIEKNFENNTLYEAENYKITFYNTSENSQKNVIEKEGVCNVNLLGCEKILKTKNSIPDDQVLNIIKVEIKRKDTISMQVEYQIYSESLEPLNLNECKNEIIKVSIPYDLKHFKKNHFRKLIEEKEITLEDQYILGLKYDYDILNSNSPFYNDICTFFDSEYSTDVIIEDRKKYYYMSQLFCEDTCIYSSYNISNQKVDCNCYTKTEPKYNRMDRNFTNNTIGSSFNKKISNANFKVFQCLGKGFNNFGKNISAYIILLIFFGFIGLSLVAIFFENNKSVVKSETVDNIQIQDKNSSTNNNLTLMTYDSALKRDNRKYFEIYLDTIKYNHLIFYTFKNKIFEKNIYLRLMLFLFFIVILFLFNMFLFLDKYFTKIYLNKGRYNFGDELPMAFVTTLICLLINMGLKILFQMKTKKKLKSIRQIRNSSNNLNKYEDEEVLSISEISEFVTT